jgi:3-oxoacyl-[acyl-carrier protein] reductase
VNSLAGKIALVTGAGRGIGRAVATQLADFGCRVILTARTLPELEEVRQEIVAHGGEAICIAADLTRDHDIQLFVEKSHQSLGSPDILINNAGWGKRSPVVKLELEDLDQTLRLNLRAPIILAKSFLPKMIEKAEGAVINIGSISGKTGEANGAAYSASKFGLIGFTQSLYEEVRQYGIKVAVILPGFVDTSLIPPNRQFDRSKMIQAADVAQTVQYILTSPASCCPVEITLRPQKSPYR